MNRLVAFSNGFVRGLAKMGAVLVFCFERRPLRELPAEWKRIDTWKFF